MLCTQSLPGAVAITVACYAVIYATVISSLANAAIVAPPWSNPANNPCASLPGGWQLLYWAPLQQCFKIFTVCCTQFLEMVRQSFPIRHRVAMFRIAERLSVSGHHGTESGRAECAAHQRRTSDGRQQRGHAGGRVSMSARHGAERSHRQMSYAVRAGAVRRWRLLCTGAGDACAESDVGGGDARWTDETTQLINRNTPPVFFVQPKETHRPVQGARSLCARFGVLAAGWQMLSGANARTVRPR